jgi:hypothetical protein
MLVSILPPSRGGIGRRLKTNNERFNNIMLLRKMAMGFASLVKKCSRLMPCHIIILVIMKAMISKNRFAKTPAIETMKFASL